MRNKKLQVWLPLIFAMVMIVGMIFGFRLQQQTGSEKFFGKSRPTSLQEVLDLIKNKYVDSVGGGLAAERCHQLSDGTSRSAFGVHSGP